MSIVERVKNICLSPTTEWPVIAAEPTSAGTLVSGYVVPLAAVGAIAGFIGGSFVGHTLPFIGTYRTPIVAGLVLAIFTFVMAIVGVVVLSLIINALAPSFGGEKNGMQALKVAAYSYTPGWVAGVLQIVPVLGILAILAALYGLYLLYLGLPRLMKCPEDKAIGYTAVVVICAIVISVVITGVTGVIAGAGMLGAGMLSGGSAGVLGGGSSAGSSSDVQFDKNSTMGRLQEIGRQLEESNKKAEAAEKRGDQAGQVAAAFEGLGTILAGGRRVDPIGIDQLKPFVPDTFAGLPRRSINTEKNGIAGFMVSKAEANYGDGAGKSVTFELSDVGNASGLLSLAGWAGLQGEKEDDEAVERTVRQDGRLVHERRAKRGGSNEFGIVLGDRFIVEAKGHGVDLSDLKSAVAGLNLAQLEAMKDVGVQK